MAKRKAIKVKQGYTAKNVIGNRFSRLKIASLLIKNIISSIGIVFVTHSVLFYIKDSKKNIPTEPMGENPLVSDGKQFTSSLMEDADNLSENVDAGIKISRPPFITQPLRRHFES